MWRSSTCRPGRRSPDQVADLIARKLDALGITAPGLTAVRAGTALPDSQAAAGPGAALTPGNPHHGTREGNTGAGMDEDRFAHEVTGELAPGHSRVLASLLGAGSRKEGAELSWAEIVAGVEGAGLAGNLTRTAGLPGNPAGVLDAIQEAARMLPAEHVAVLAVAVEGITTWTSPAG